MTSTKPAPSTQRVPPIVVVGTGSIGSRHLDVLRSVAGMKTLALPVRAERRDALANTGTTVPLSLADAVSRGAGLAIIATETSRHVPDALEALAAGLDVLIEKPVAPTAEQATLLRTAAQRANRRVHVACNLRFNESLNAFRSLLPRLGPLHGVRIECQSYLPEWRPARAYQATYSARAEDGGVLRDLIHEIDYAGWLFGWPNRLQARVRNLGRLSIAAEETAELSWETPSGALLSIQIDYLSRPARRVLRAFGSSGTLAWDGIHSTCSLHRVGADVETLRSTETRDDMYLAQDRAFAQLHDGMKSSDDRLATLEDGIRALAVCDAARIASAERREVPVTYP